MSCNCMFYWTNSLQPQNILLLKVIQKVYTWTGINLTFYILWASADFFSLISDNCSSAAFGSGPILRMHDLLTPTIHSQSEQKT